MAIVMAATPTSATSLTLSEGVSKSMGGEQSDLLMAMVTCTPPRDSRRRCPKPSAMVNMSSRASGRSTKAHASSVRAITTLDVVSSITEKRP